MLISPFFGIGQTLILCPQKPYQMRLFIKKSAEALGVFSPIILLIFVCSAYLYYPAHENIKNNTEMMQDGMKRNPERLSENIGAITANLQW
jgi:hypothetical protein